MTTYAVGLRASEVIALKPKHIESEKMLIKVEDGKGRKDRYTMLSPQRRHDFNRLPENETANSLRQNNLLPMDEQFGTQ